MFSNLDYPDIYLFVRLTVRTDTVVLPYNILFERKLCFALQVVALDVWISMCVVSMQAAY